MVAQAFRPAIARLKACATATLRAQGNLVDDLIVGGFLHPVVDRFEMGDLESTHRLDG